jgi:hypothetical protein
VKNGARLRGFATVKLRNGHLVHDVVAHSSNGGAWAALPSKPMIDRDGRVMRDAGSGKIKYAPVLEWPDQATSERFSAAVVALVEAQHEGGPISAVPLQSDACAVTPACRVEHRASDPGFGLLGGQRPGAAAAGSAASRARASRSICKAALAPANRASRHSASHS